MLGWWFAAHASEPCSIRVDAERIDAALERIEASWAALDDLEFVRGVDELHLLLPCVTEVVPPGTAARIHRAYALESWVRGATADGVVALAAARQIEPGWPEPPGWFPEALAAAAAEPPGASRAVPPRDGGLVFDGTPDARRPERPSFVQWVGGDGDVRASWYVRPDEPLPDYDPAYKSRRNLVSLGVAGVVADVLADPVARSPAFGRYGPLERPYWAAVKTGTSTGYRDNWTVGFTRDVAVGVWVGNFDGRAMGDVSGVTGAGPLWAAVLDRATELRSGGRSPAPPDPPGWERRDSCALSGGAPGPRCPHVVSDWARIGSPPAAPCGWHRAGPDGATCVDWPPELVPWAADHGLITPCGGDVAPGEVPRDPDPAVAITYPPPGTIVYVDPRIPADHQQVPLRAAVAVDAGLVEWIVDGARIATAEPGAVTLWRPPSTGAHEIAVAVDGRRRDTVTIEVRGHP
ncbi:MAG: hypothetical protein ABMB14_34280 [Myxococcota bacterium]